MAGSVRIRLRFHLRHSRLISHPTEGLLPAAAPRRGQLQAIMALLPSKQGLLDRRGMYTHRHRHPCLAATRQRVVALVSTRARQRHLLYLRSWSHLQGPKDTHRAYFRSEALAQCLALARAPHPPTRAS